MMSNRIEPVPFRFPSEIGPRTPIPQRPTGPETAPGETVEPGRGSFTDSLREALSEVNEMQHHAAGRVEAFVRGEDVPLHEIVLAQEEAEISFRLLLEIRDRLVRAYQEILRTPM
jgi:flagellar hook-basal body complex protein FliE